MKPIEKEIFEFWKQINPDITFKMGLNDYAATMFIPFTENVAAANKHVQTLKKRTKDPRIKKFLVAMEYSYKYPEPMDGPNIIFGVIEDHLMKEGIDAKHLELLIEQSYGALDAYTEECCHLQWPIEIRILTTNACNNLISLLKTIEKNARSKHLQQDLEKLINKVRKFRDDYKVKEIKRGDFGEVYPILKRRSKYINRKGHYARILKHAYDYSETPEQIENKAMKWLEEDLKALKLVKKNISHMYNCKNTTKDIEKEIKKRTGLPRADLIDTAKKLNKLLRPIMEKNFIEISKTHKSEIIETPSYLTTVLPTAALTTFNNLGKEFKNVIYITTDEKAAPADSMPSLLNTFIHEEYGHGVNMSNTVNAYHKKKISVLSVISDLDIPITEGISFNREYETMAYFKDLLIKELTKEERALIHFLEKFGGLEEIVDFMEYELYKWRVIRFLRAICDVRVNTNKQGYYRFVEWAYRFTGLKRKDVYDQTFFFIETPGYPPAYSLAGMFLMDLQRNSNAPLKKINTYAASVGFPGKSIWEKQLTQEFPAQVYK